MRAAVEALVQAALEAEMTEAIGAAKGERSETRLLYRLLQPLADYPGWHAGVGYSQIARWMIGGGKRWRR